MKLALMLIFSMLSVGAAHAQSCGSADIQRIQNEILPVLQVTTEAGEAVTADQICKSKSLASIVFRSVLFMKDVQVESTPADEFNLDLMKGAPYPFFQGLVKKLVLDETNTDDLCQSGAAAYFARGDDRSKGEIHVCGTAKPLDAVTLSGILVHEASHLLGPWMAHSVCKWGPLAGENSCDSSYEEGLSYAYNIEYSIKLWRSKNLPMDVRQRARLDAVSDLLIRFNDPPLDIVNGVMLVDQDNQPYFYDGARLKRVNVSLPRESAVISRGALLSYLDAGSGTIKSYAFQGERFTQKDRLSELYASLPASERAQVLNTFYGRKANSYACLIFPHTLKCINRQSEAFTVDIPDFEVKGAIMTPRSVFVPKNTLSLVNDQGRILLLPETAEELKASPASSWRQSRSTVEFVELHPWMSGNEIALNKDGSVSVFNRSTGTWTVPPVLQGMSFKRMIPQSWSERLPSL